MPSSPASPKAGAASPTTVDSKGDTSKPSNTPRLFGSFEVPEMLLTAFARATQLCFFVFSIFNAHRIRTHALVEYGMIIHEFDPWFNFRATRYLSKQGWHAFFHWFDYMVWYPLGRPVGTTIYPGLQITSVIIHRVLKWMGPGFKMSLNDVCCFVPCWGGAASTFLIGLLTQEVTQSYTCSTVAALVMAIVPAHIMRSVGGGYDNESIAMTAMLLTFYFWLRSLRHSGSWPLGILAGLAYGYMVSAWGGYVFVLNMVALHAGISMVIDMFRNKFSDRMHKSYTLFYIIGTYIATCVPPVGMMPLKSLEQLFAFVVFGAMQVIWYSEKLRKKADVEILSADGIKIRFKCISAAFMGLIGVIVLLSPTGYFGPISSRVRALFLQHTRTGNPLVDSVAEHQPASSEAYWHYLHLACYGWQIGMFVLPFVGKRLRASQFIFIYSLAAYFFSLKMARLIILCGPVASILCGVVFGRIVEWCFSQCFWSEADDVQAARAASDKDASGKKVKANKRDDPGLEASVARLKRQYAAARHIRIGVAIGLMCLILFGNTWSSFSRHCEQMAVSFANPQLLFKTRMPNGQVVMVDDYREAYFWLRDHTAADSRVMAWWDYGYQITGIGDRISIADGNTWNHEHIATLGKCLTSPVKEAHVLIRHLADYVLVWAGGQGDDLAKSPHMARIGNSVYRDICPDDPLCSHFGFRRENYEDPTPMMRKSLLYNLHAHNQKAGVRIDTKLFEEAYSTKYGLVRIFKVMNVSEESKAWCADPANRICDAPGSWYCVGQYPPAEPIQALIAKRRVYGQLEDFNRNNQDDDYYRQYMARMGAA